MSSTSTRRLVFPCPSCDKVYAHSSGLTRHVQAIHDPYASRFRCQFPDCAYTTTRKTSMERHMGVHDPNRGPLLPCKYPGCSFTGTNLVRHLRWHRDLEGGTRDLMTLAIEGLTRPAATVDSLQGDGSKNSHIDDFTTVDSNSLEPGSTRMTGGIKHQTHHWDGKGLVLLAADDSGNQGPVEPASTLGESDASISRMDEPTLNSQHLSSALPHDIHAAIPDPDLETCPEEWRWLFEMLNGDGQDTQQSLGSYDLTSPCF